MKTWRERIRDARQRNGIFTPIDIKAAGQWRTCAIGEQYMEHFELIRFNIDGSPCDEEFDFFGRAFMIAVIDGNPDRAERYLDRIQDRVLEMKREQA